MYVIFNPDGSVREKQFADYVNQHSDGVNFIDFAIVGFSVDKYTASGNFSLPNGDVVSQPAVFHKGIKTSSGDFDGYRLTLSATETEYNGKLGLSISFVDSDKNALFTYPVEITVNATTEVGTNNITEDQYKNLMATIASYQLQFSKTNMRGYSTLAEAEADVDSLAIGQIVVAREKASDEYASMYIKLKEGKLTGLGVDGLATDQYMKRFNPTGYGEYFKLSFSEKAPEDSVITIRPGDNVLCLPHGGISFGSNLAFLEGRSTYLDDTQISLGDYGKTIQWIDVLSKADKAVPNGLATLGNDGKVPSSQLPSYVSNVREYATLTAFPTVGEDNVIYVALDTNLTYRWGGTQYVEISASLALGETAETAWAGDKGKKNADDITALRGYVDGKFDALPQNIMKNGTGTGSAMQQPQSGKTVSMAGGKNPNAVSLNAIFGQDNAVDASGDYSSIFGGAARATGKRTMAQGTNTWAYGNYSHAEGDNAVSYGTESHAEGYGTLAQGAQSHAEGGSTVAQGATSHAEGIETIARGNYSHVEGNQSRAVGGISHAEGVLTQANGYASHSEGDTTSVLTELPSSGGGGGGGTEPSLPEEWDPREHFGEKGHAEGTYTTVVGYSAHAEGYKTKAYGPVSHAEGYNTTTGDSADGTKGWRSHAEGLNTKAIGDTTHAEGSGTTASGDYSHAEGANTQANGNYSHAEGNGSKTTADTSHAEGEACVASGRASHAEGSNTTASGECSHAEGGTTVAQGAYSHAEGNGTVATNPYETVVGKYNEWMSNALFEVGYGTSPTNRQTALWVTTDGKTHVGKAPTEGNDVANKSYVDSKVASGMEAKKYYTHLLTIMAGNLLFYAQISSSSNLKIDSLQDLSTVTGKDAFAVIGAQSYGGVARFTNNIWQINVVGSTPTLSITSVGDEVTLQ